MKRAAVEDKPRPYRNRFRIDRRGGLYARPELSIQEAAGISQTSSRRDQRTHLVTISRLFYADTPAKAEIQNPPKNLDSSFRRNDDPRPSKHFEIVTWMSPLLRSCSVQLEPCHPKANRSLPAPPANERCPQSFPRSLKRFCPSTLQVFTVRASSITPRFHRMSAPSRESKSVPMGPRLYTPDFGSRASTTRNP